LDGFLEKELLPLLVEEGVEVLELRETGRAGRPVFRVIVDRRDQEISIEDCAYLTRKLRKYLTDNAQVAGDWRLEVSSPGIGYPLRQVWQFRKNRGRLLKVTIPGDEGPREISGRLAAAEEEGFDIETDDGRRHFAHGDVLSARVLPEIRSFPRESKRR
jgi:ribosome maturation factor RimP